MLVLLDTGIYVSAAISPTGVARRVVQAGIAGRFDYLVCPMLLAELDDVLARPKIARLLPSGAASRFIADIRGRARLEADPVDPRRATRDPRDDYLVALAAAVTADWLVTGDADLLDLRDPPVPVASLRGFADLLDAT